MSTTERTSSVDGAGLEHVEHGAPSSKRAMAALSLGALGVVYGDIGTSPLYAVRECFAHHVPTHDRVLGVISLIIWALLLVVIGKYLTFVLKADNRGEGGVLALLALAMPVVDSARIRRMMLFLGLSGAALLFADGTITPAISVLSAVEGLSVAAPELHGGIVPAIAGGILVVLFAVQRRGTGQLGTFFGPVVMLWFFSIAAVGFPWVLKHPEILAAFDPRHAIAFLSQGVAGYVVLGAVVLCVTGGEALYADLGHFGRWPIRWAWYTVAFPGLLLSYLGQGAYLLDKHGEPVGNLFYEMVPAPLLLPMIGIATLATVVASQSMITGVFAMVHQAVQLGYLPRMTVVHTSNDIENRIYIPQANALLFLFCMVLVFGFGSSSALAAAYGIAVTGSMAMTSFIYFAAMQKSWGLFKTTLVAGTFLVVDVTFFSATMPKIAHGGWVPLAIAILFIAVMTSWQRGTELVSKQLKLLELPLATFLESLNERKIARVPGTALFLTREALGTPPMLVHYVDHSLALQENVILLTVQVEHKPRVKDTKRIETESIGHGFHRVRVRYGFMEIPDLSWVVGACESRGIPVSIDDATIFVGHSTVVTTGKSRMHHWRKNLFEMLNRNARPASTHYHLPSTRVVEIGVRIEI